jgi:hypothetical protein
MVYIGKMAKPTIGSNMSQNETRYLGQNNASNRCWADRTLI